MNDSRRLNPVLSSRAFLPVLVIASAVATGCGSDQPIERIGRASGALEAVTVSEPFEIEAEPANPLNPRSKFVSACGPVRCLLVQSVTLPWGSAISYERLGRDGTRLDARPKWLGLGHFDYQYSPAFIAPVGDDFVVAIVSSETVVRISGDDGTVLGALDAIPNPTALASDATSLAVVFDDGAGGSLLRVYDGNTFAPVGPDVVVPAKSSLLAADGAYLAYNRSAFVRVSASTGAAAFAPVTYNRYLDVHEVGAVFLDGTYVIGVQVKAMYSEIASLVAFRVGVDGSVQDVDDQFNEFTGGKMVCEYCGSWGEPRKQFSVHRSGNDALFVFANTSLPSDALSASRFSVATGTTLHGSTTAPELALGTAGYAVEVEIDGGVGYSLVSADYGSVLESWTITSSPFAITRTNPRPASRSGSDRTMPSIATNGSTYLVTFARDSVLYGSRIDATTGAILDTPPLQLGPAYEAAVGTNGTDYIVVSYSDGGYYGGTRLLDMHRRVVRADGTLEIDRVRTDEHSVSGYTYTPGTMKGLRVHWTGAYYVVTLAVASEAGGLRFDSDGVLLDPEVAPYGSIGSSLGLEAVVDHPSDPATATLVAGYVPYGPSTPNAVVRRYRVHAGSMIATTTPLGDGTTAAFQGMVGAASSGSQVVFAWKQGGRGLLREFDSTTGAAVGAAVAIDPTVADVHWNGRSFLVASRRYVAGETWYGLHRYAAGTLADLDAPLGANGHLIALDDERSLPLDRVSAIATASPGRSLVVTLENSYDRGTLRLVGRFVTDTGEASPVVDAGVDAGSTMPIEDGGTEDAGSPEDAGVEGTIDAGAVDAGGGVDSGRPDAGSRDAGRPVDAGSSDGLDSGSIDPSVEVDAGRGGKRSGGCGVASSSAPVALVEAMAIVAIGLARRRRRVAARP